MVLAFAREARLRGYQVILIPKIPDSPIHSFPDVLLKKGDERILVEIERLKAKRRKWYNLYDQQGFIAVCTLTPSTRKTILKEILTLDVPGQATDLETLRRQSVAGNPGSLWLERW